MAAISPLSIGFIETRPRPAARALAALEPADAAAFLDTLETRYAALVLARMDAWPAARMLTLMTPVSAAALANALDYEQAASILRLLAPEDREPVLAALPRTLARDLRASLAFPADTVGAHMSFALITQPPDHSVADALAELRSPRTASVDTVYIVSDKRSLLGQVSAADLLQRPDSALLADIMDREVSPVSARARLSAVADLPAWDSHATLPVLNRNGRLTGVVSRARVLQAGRPGEPASAGLGDSLPGALVMAFAASTSGLVQLLAGGDQT
ncbi:magnesium transporter MgtE N-terminal domain-containing protein [Maricaulis sp. CAU 1757]